MKLLGITNGKKVVASMSRYDYRFEDGMMADGGNPLTNYYGGYTRFSCGPEFEVVWFEIPQTFAELYQDYAFNAQRLYGVWNIEDVRILEENEYPDTSSIEEKSKTFCWGNRGPLGDQPLKYVPICECSLEHLQNILKNVPSIHFETKQVIKYLIAQKNHEAQNQSLSSRVD